MIFKRQLEHWQFNAEGTAFPFCCCDLDFGPVRSADRFYVPLISGAKASLISAASQPGR
jgi:hypothetical protein